MEVERAKVVSTEGTSPYLKLSWKELPAIFLSFPLFYYRQINIMSSGLSGYSLFAILIVLVTVFFYFGSISKYI